ncbi:hypothetical protein, partial [Helicobacter bizzozeronii]|uniref:hypothetical protein n=1 Tax=Helicobacter bizzozeronii TaxID=56877 RepID=UPI0025572824
PTPQATPESEPGMAFSIEDLLPVESDHDEHDGVAMEDSKPTPPAESADSPITHAHAMHADMLQDLIQEHPSKTQDLMDSTEQMGDLHAGVDGSAQNSDTEPEPTQSTPPLEPQVEPAPTAKSEVTLEGSELGAQAHTETATEPPVAQLEQSGLDIQEIPADLQELTQTHLAEPTEEQPAPISADMGDAKIADSSELEPEMPPELLEGLESVESKEGHSLNQTEQTPPTPTELLDAMPEALEPTKPAEPTPPQEADTHAEPSTDSQELKQADLTAHSDSMEQPTDSQEPTAELEALPEMDTHEEELAPSQEIQEDSLETPSLEDSIEAMGAEPAPPIEPLEEPLELEADMLLEPEMLQDILESVAASIEPMENTSTLAEQEPLIPTPLESQELPTPLESSTEPAEPTLLEAQELETQEGEAIGAAESEVALEQEETEPKLETEEQHLNLEGAEELAQQDVPGSVLAQTHPKTPEPQTIEHIEDIPTAVMTSVMDGSYEESLKSQEGAKEAITPQQAEQQPTPQAPSTEAPTQASAPATITLNTLDLQTLLKDLPIDPKILENKVLRIQLVDKE